MNKLRGVTSVEVSLNQGTVSLELEPGNKLTLEEVREVIRKNGFTPKDARVTIAGQIVERNGKPALAVAGIGEVLLLDGGGGGRKGEHVIVTGTRPASQATNAPPRLTVASIRAEQAESP